MRTRRAQRKKRLDLRLLLASLLLLVGCGLLLLDPIKQHLIQQGIDANAVSRLKRRDIEQNLQRSVSYDFQAVKPITALNVIQNAQKQQDLPTIGAVAIPSVQLNLPIYLGVTDEGMYLGACTLVENQQMGQSNYTLGSHHSIQKGMLFEPLKRVERGTIVYLTDLDKIYQYKVTNVEIIDPHRLDVLDPTDKATITLLTCDDTLENRLIVQGELEQSYPIQSAPSDVLKVFDLSVSVPSNS